jgi:hypothetical protein
MHNDCRCADCATGKIRSVAGPGCDLPAHEFTEVDGTCCWNCGAAAPSEQHEPRERITIPDRRR